MNNLYILTGENSYQLLREKKHWIDEFAKKHGRDNLMRTDGENTTINTLLDEVAVAPFLARKRLVVVDGIIRCTKEEARLLYDGMHPDVLLLFVDPKPDKRNGGIKELLLLAEKNVKNFPLLHGSSLAAWADAYAREHGGMLQTAARNLLLEWNGNDQGMLAHEMDTLLLVTGGNPVSVDLVERYCTPTDEGIIWTIGDYLAAGTRNKALLYAHRMLDRGSDPNGLWSVLLSLLKNIVAVYAALAARVPASHIPADTGIHPFAVRSILGYCKRMNENSLFSVLSWATKEDVRLKTGGYRSTVDETEEIDALIDSLLLRMP